MGDAIDDIDALLEESYKKKEDKDHGSRKEENGEKGGSRSSRERRSRSRDRKHRSRSRERSHRGGRSRSKDKRKSRSKSRDRKRSRSKDRGSSRRDTKRRSRSRSRDRKRRSRSRERGGGFGAGRSPLRGGRRSPPRFGGGGRFGSGRAPSRSKSPDVPLTPEERDARTVFVMQLSQRVRARDIEEFFSSVGKIKDVKLIICNKTRRFKGISYVEFKDIESVTLALGLQGQKLLGVPVIVQPSQAEKNRVSSYGTDQSMQGPGGRGPNDKGPMRLYIGSLHFNITEDMLKGIFEPFGKIQNIQLINDPETGRSKGYGFLTYAEADDAKKALEQMNGFELAGRAMKVGHVTERGGGGGDGSSAMFKQSSGLDAEEVDKTGIDLGASGRLALMAKLAQGTGMQLPQAANQALNIVQAPAMVPGVPPPSLPTPQQQAQQQLAQQAPPIATQCFMLSNMFDPSDETAPGWDQDVRDDVIEEGSKHGGFLHIVVDKQSAQGNVYVKCPNITTAVAAVNALHGRWFAGKVITAAYVPVVNYHNLFPDSAYANQILSTRR